MTDVVVAVIMVGTGALLCLRGCGAIRVALPLAAAAAGLLLGAAAVHVLTGHELLADPGAWIVALLVAALAGASARRWFEVATAVAFTAMGGAIAVAMTFALGDGWSPWAACIGMATGLVIGLLCAVADLPRIFHAVVTAASGAAAVAAGVVLVGNWLRTADLASPDTITSIPHRPLWVAVWAGVAVTGVAAQVRTRDRATLRDRFVDAGGGQLRET